jgi:hypothetical protein
MRTDTPPGMKVPADLMKAQGLVVGGLGADSSKTNAEPTVQEERLRHSLVPHLYGALARNV